MVGPELLKNRVVIIQLMPAINFTSFLFSLPISLILQGYQVGWSKYKGYLHQIWKCWKRKRFPGLYPAQAESLSHLLVHELGAIPVIENVSSRNRRNLPDIVLPY